MFGVSRILVTVCPAPTGPQRDPPPHIGVFDRLNLSTPLARNAGHSATDTRPVPAPGPAPITVSHQWPVFRRE
jgi:hypothetical protein